VEMNQDQWAFRLYLVTMLIIVLAFIAAIVVLATCQLDSTTKLAVLGSVFSLLFALIHGFAGLYSQPPSQKIESTETVTQVTKTETPKGT
jgi:hypothetical protein